jgi:hypothetical protein
VLFEGRECLPTCPRVCHTCMFFFYLVKYKGDLELIFWLQKKKNHCKKPKTSLDLMLKFFYLKGIFVVFTMHFYFIYLIKY